MSVPWRRFAHGPMCSIEKLWRRNFLIDRIEHIGPGTRPELAGVRRPRKEHTSKRCSVKEALTRVFTHPELA